MSRTIYPDHHHHHWPQTCSNNTLHSNHREVITWGLSNSHEYIQWVSVFFHHSSSMPGEARGIKNWTISEHTLHCLLVLYSANYLGNSIQSSTMVLLSACTIQIMCHVTLHPRMYYLLLWYDFLHFHFMIQKNNVVKA